MRTPIFLALLLAGCALRPSTPSGTTAPPQATAEELEKKAALARHALPLLQRQWEVERSPYVAYDAADSAAAVGHLDEGIDWLSRAVDAGLDNDRWLRDDGDLAPLRGDPRFAPLQARARANAESAAHLFGTGLQRTTPEQAGIDAKALAALLEGAEQSHSTALIVLHDGKLAGEWNFGATEHRTEAMSATKSVVSLAIGMLIDDGKLTSIDQPLSTFFPAWSSGRKAKVTLRHLLNHTSGMAAHADTADIYASDDFVQFALDAELIEEPGARFFYNNKAVNLLAAVVERASGERMDRYLARRLFAPLGITHVGWWLDHSGNPHAMAGLQIHPIDFAKIGQLLLDGGVWEGKRIVSESWIAASTSAASQPLNISCALLWWLQSPDERRLLDGKAFERLQASGAPEDALAQAKLLVDRPVTVDEWRAVVNKPLPSGKQLWDALAAAQISAQLVFGAPADGFSARGYDGQFLAVFPSRRLVVMRMADPDDALPAGQIDFNRFFTLARALVPPHP